MLQGNSEAWVLPGHHVHYLSMQLHNVSGCLLVPQGNAEAWFHLGTMYLNGWGVKPSQRQAVDYFALAAQMGHVLGMYNLAMMHLHGRAGLAGAEGSTNCPPALALLKKIAEKGSWGALVQQVTDQGGLIAMHEWVVMLAETRHLLSVQMCCSLHSSPS